ncbi:MAG: hypothetical protein HOV79_27905 [Hamadaea sp.]|nr:hypothetical protein [Hamadaea sp.]
MLVEEQAYEDVTPVARMAAISPTTVPVHGCFLGTGSGSIFLREVACSTAHNAEYAGSFLSTASQAPLSRADWEALHVKCRGVVARFLGTSIERSNDRYSNIASTISKNFSGGERGVRCFLYLGRSRVSSSAEGRGTTVPAWS